MSTKTSIKRIAAVAAVALTLGGFSAVSAHATTYDFTFATTGAATDATASTTATAKGVADGNHYITVTLTDTATTAADNAVTVASSGVGSIYGTATAAGNGSLGAGHATSVVNNTSGTSANGFLWSSDATFPTGATSQFSATNTVTFSVVSATAGTQTITATPTNGSSGAVTLTITWGAAPAISTQYSTANIALTSATASVDTAGEYTGTDAAIVASSTASTTAAAVIGVTLSSAYDTPFSAPLTAAVTGAGAVAIMEDGATQRAFSYSTSGIGSTGTSVTSATSNKFYRVFVYPNGINGVGTITLTSGTTAIATKTITFSGSAKAVAAVQNLKVLMAGGTATNAGGTAGTDAVTTTAGQYYYGALSSYYSAQTLTPALSSTAYTTSGASANVPTPVITVRTTDSAGNQAPITVNYGTNIKIVVSDSSVLTAVGCTNVATYKDAASVSHANEINCAVVGTTGAASGASATATVELYNSTTSAWDILATPLTFSIGGAVASETAALDSATYTPGQPMVLTVTAKDSKGNAAYDQDASFFGSGKSSVYTPSIPAPATISGGVGTGKGYAPTVEGDFTLSGTDASALLNAISVKATVVGGSSSAAQAAVDAANEATDAANAATDAANNAMDSADAAQQAALDAGDKADAALAAVTDLATKVSAIASQIAALSALVKKIAAKVKA